MKAKEKDHVVNYLLTQMTYILLAKSPIKDAMQQAAEKHENRLRAMLTKEELEPIQVMRDTMRILATKLANCVSADELKHTHAYIEALNNGEVLIANLDETTAEVTSYEVSR